jgi:hypothetical protein
VTEDEVEALAEVLSWASGEMTRWSETANEDHNRWSWRGDRHGKGARAEYRRQARLVLAEGWARDAGLVAEVVALCDPWVQNTTLAGDLARRICAALAGDTE